MRKHKDILSTVMIIAIIGGFLVFFSLFEEDSMASSSHHLELGATVTADTRGASTARVCTTCHDMTAARKHNSFGPPLWGIVGRPAGTMPGYTYSSAHMNYADNCGMWDLEMLDAYLKDPRDFIPGNKMAYAGIKDYQERQQLLDYLKTLHDKQSREESKTLRTALNCDSTAQ